jgi:DNA-binding transcriptional ArsR family regulator
MGAGHRDEAELASCTVSCVTAQAHRDPVEGQVDLAVEMFKLLGDGTRLRILWALLHGEHSVNELAEHVGAQPAAVSQHLAKLRWARLVKVRRDGNRMFYAAQDAHVRRLVEEALFHADHVGGRRPQPAPPGASRRQRA